MELHAHAEAAGPAGFALTLEKDRIRAIIYWGTTALLAMAFLSGGVRHLMQAPDVVAGISALGYPLYFILLLGVWKLLGGITILAPGLPRLKEWAYAGMFFDLTGAAVSHAAMRSPGWHVAVTLSLAGLVLVSWWSRPADRKL
jgi:uncharacterized membrane protein YphA (DoxX/SURF4 family)